jgi:glutathione S-transferase
MIQGECIRAGCGHENKGRVVMNAKLYAFRLSHYCEKARWALDASQTAYDEINWAPGPHVMAAKRLTGGRRTTTPIVEIDGEIIQGSDVILDRFNFANIDAELETLFDDEVGPAIRRAYYHCAFTDPHFDLKRQLAQGVTGMMRTVFFSMWPVTRGLMKDRLTINASAVETVLSDMAVLLDRLDNIVSDHPILNGEALDRHIITCAALLAGLARPKAHPVYRDNDTMPERWRRFVDEHKDRPSMRWTHTAYERFRQLP